MSGRYFSSKVQFMGQTFDSKEELKAYLMLKDMERRGEISQLHRQVSFEIIPQLLKKRILHLKTKDKTEWVVAVRQKVYTCDFLYREGDRIVILEVKNFFTKQARDYPLRRDLMARKIVLHNDKRHCETFTFKEYTQEKNGKYKIITIV